MIAAESEVLRWFLEEHSPSEVVRLLAFVGKVEFEVNEGRVVKHGSGGSDPSGPPETKVLNAVAGKTV